MLIVAVLLVGLIIAVYLVQTKQIFKSRASGPNQDFEISQGTGDSRENVECKDDVCTTSSLDIFIKPKSPGYQPNVPVPAFVTPP